jgi:hypothetical protein
MQRKAAVLSQAWATAILWSRDSRRGLVRRSYGPRIAPRPAEQYISPRADGRPTLAANTSAAGSEWVACRCCGKLFPAANVVRFRYHLDDAVCVCCVEWLHARSRPIVRRLYPIWQLPARLKFAASSAAGSHAGSDSSR